MLDNSQRTRIFDPSGKVLLAEWVSIHFREDGSCEYIGQTIGNTIDRVIPRPDLQRKPVAQNTKWRG